MSPTKTNLFVISLGTLTNWYHFKSKSQKTIKDICFVFFKNSKNEGHPRISLLDISVTVKIDPLISQPSVYLLLDPLHPKLFFATLILNEKTYFTSKQLTISSNSPSIL